MDQLVQKYKIKISYSVGTQEYTSYFKPNHKIDFNRENIIHYGVHRFTDSMSMRSTPKIFKTTKKIDEVVSILHSSIGIQSTLTYGGKSYTTTNIEVVRIEE